MQSVTRSSIDDIFYRAIRNKLSFAPSRGEREKEGCDRLTISIETECIFSFSMEAKQWQIEK